MARQHIIAPCFLCGARAAYIETDPLNRRHYECSNPECGSYEISTKIMREKENSSVFKKEIMNLAKQGQATGQYVEINRVSDDKVTATLISASRTLDE